MDCLLEKASPNHHDEIQVVDTGSLMTIEHLYLSLIWIEYFIKEGGASPIVTSPERKGR